MNDDARLRAGLRTRADVPDRHHPEVTTLAETLRWATVAALAAAALRFPTSGFWSIGPRQPLVLARATVGPGRFQQAAPD